MPIPQQILQRDDVFHKVPPLSEAEGRQRLLAITKRNATSLGGLRGDRLMLIYYHEDPERIFGQEWGLAREPRVVNPECIIVSGGPDGVQWAPFLNAGLVPLAHSHPYHERTPGTTRALPATGVRWDAIAGTPNVPQFHHGRTMVFPSAGDFAFAAAANFAVHTVYTPYAVIGHGPARTIFNTTAAEAQGAPRLVFRLQGISWVNDGHYRATIIAMANSQPFWTKPYVDVHGGGGKTIDL